MTRQDNFTTMTELPAHISRHLEPLVRDIEAIQRKDYAAMSLYGAVAFRRGFVPPGGTFSEIRDGLIEAAKIHDEQRLTNSEGEVKKATSLFLNDWVLRIECGDKSQKFTHPDHCLDYILRLFPEMKKEEAWHLAQAESKKRNETEREAYREADREPSIEDAAHDYAFTVAGKKHPACLNREYPHLKPRSRQDFISEILWSKQYDEAYRTEIKTLEGGAVFLVSRSFLSAPRTSSRSRRSPVRSAAKSGGDDGGGDSESDPGDPPGPKLTVPSLSTSPTLTTPQRNNSTLSRTPHPCRWPMGRWAV